ncbi:WD repeat-containing protein 44 [Hordeum vulgare]|uniref:WD repeat-containing protein 44 n=1 Tax=Hordeum vulgare subsp. vulgare TaxID=112509 RepID=A0A8I6YQ29_HORVV|nr:WD repeat-containing protein 44-like [Hordeum vulgare subsp. vulgare]KAE8807220.1 WD repeat-containing protein 44 [Hordeum vulgare]
MRGADGEKEAFFHCLDRVPSGIHIDTDHPSDDDDDEDEEEARGSFSSAMGDRNFQSFRRAQAGMLVEDEDQEPEPEMEDASKYDMWMSDEPMSIQERRRRLHQGLGMVSSRDLALRRHSTKKRFVDVPRSVSRRMQQMPPSLPVASTPTPSVAAPPSGLAAARDMLKQRPAKPITRRRSDGFLAVRDGSGKGPTPLRRARSLLSPHDPCSSSLIDKFKATRDMPMPAVAMPAPADKGTKCDEEDDGGQTKKQDKSKEGAVMAAAPKDQNQTGVQLGLEEIEKFIGNTPIMKHLMRRGPSQHHSQPMPPAAAAAAAPPKGDKSAAKKKGGWFKNIKSVATTIGFIQDNGKPVPAPMATGAAPSPGPASATVPSSSSSSSTSTEKLKVQNYGKSSKELTGLYMSQEIQAHEGSIWSIKFSADGRRLASAGEDCLVRVWEVVETSAPPSSVPQDGSLPPLPGGSDGSSSQAPGLSKKSTTKGGKTVLPEHLVVPDKVFALAEQALCVLEGHEDDVLDLTWSKSDQLLSSSMDKTVRLWDTASKACLKKFSHSDYVTSIQFNPVDDRYFISGSLDAKVRLWSIPNRQVVDWTDVNEMVTATSYSPDGQGAIIGSHQGSCRFYKTADCKLSPEAQIDVQSKKRKSQAKKITGFQFAPGNPSEVLVTSADSQIRVFDGVTMVQKFRGFKNTSSQIAAAYTSDGRYVVCASEDSHVYIWRTTRSAPAAAAIGIGMKPKTWCTIRSYENFYCKDVSAAIPWTHSPSLPGSPQSHHGVVSCNDEVCSMASHAAKPDVSKSGELSRVSKSGELSSPAAPSPSPHSGPLDTRHASKSGANASDTGNAWGLVVVTATLSGEIRVYQNFGMPFRIKGQGNLFY